MSDGHVLIVEDDAFIALDLETAALSAGVERTTLCASVAEARRAAAMQIDFALLDIDLGDGQSYEIARDLKERGIPFAFVSASRATDLPPDLAGTPFIAKPFFAIAITGAVRRALAAPE